MRVLKYVSVILCFVDRASLYNLVNEANKLCTELALLARLSVVLFNVRTEIDLNSRCLVTYLSANNSATHKARLCTRHCVKKSAANSKAQFNHMSFSQSD